MRKFSKGLLLLGSVAALGLSGCSDDSPWSGSDSVGGIHLNLETDGRIMKHATKADDTMSPIVPDGNAFAISLNHVDGSYSKTWTNIEAFNNEESFPIGDYKINAVYGDLGKEGFERPCFMAVEDVHVAPGDNAEVSMVATLANSMVSIRYNDDFINNFPQYSASVQTPGKDWVVFAQTETRPAYVDPSADGNTKVSITMFNKKNEKVTIEPAKFKLQPRRHYIITINAVGNVAQGNLSLQVEFEEDVVSESVEISLTDELFSSPAPEIKPKNFTAGQPISFIANEELSCDPQFDLFAFGGFEEVTMNVQGPESYTPIFGNPVEFISSESIVRQQLESVGVAVSGLYPVAGLMAVVNLKKYLEQVPPGNYSITLQAKDKLTRLSDPVVLNASVLPLEMKVSLAEDVPYRANEISIIVASNSRRVEHNLTFELIDKQGYPINAELKEVTDASVDGFVSAKKYTLSTDPITTGEVRATISCGRIAKDLTIDIVDPEYSVEVDAFAQFVVLHILAVDPDLQNDLVDNLGIYNGNSRVLETRIERDRINNIITIKDTHGGVTYNNIKTVLGQFEKVLPPFSTENEDDVTNGDFSSRSLNLRFDEIQVGGKYRVGRDYTIRTNINRYEPSGWATVNSLTAANSSTNKNTWYVVPSSYMSDDGRIIIQSVGYNHAGANIPTSSQTTTYYCTNHPSDDQLNKAAGELFLGSYPQGGSRTNGIAFSSRPSSMTFDYKYTPLNGEQAQAEIRIYDAAGNVISQKDEYLSATPDMTSSTITLPPYPFGKKAAKIYICFRSTRDGITPAINIPSGSDLNEHLSNGLPISGVSTVADLTFKAVAKGSELVLDNVSLGYNQVVGVKDVPNNKSKR